MKNKDYWTKRKANLIYEQMDKAEKQADKFDEIYKQSKDYLDKQINKVFDKFQRDYGLSERDARQVLKNMKDQKDLAELRKVLEARPNDPNIQRLLVDLDSPVYAYRMKRLERLSADLDLMRSSIYLSEKKGSDAFYSDLMKDSYYKATFDLQQQTGFAYSFSDLPETEIKRLQGLKWMGDAYSDRIWSNTGALASSVKDELLVSLMTGRSARDTSQAIAERFEVGQNKARRLIRTESAFFHNQMELLSYEDAEITKYKFVAVLDRRTSEICQEHDNKVYDTDKAVPGVNYPPLHPWCRSTTVAYDEDADYSKLERRARNPETGKTELVPADMSYDKWYDKYVAKDRGKSYNQGMDKSIPKVSSGSISAARGDVEKQKNAFAVRYYNQLRNSDRADVVKKMVNSSGLPYSTVSKALEHILDNKYLLWDYEAFEERMMNFYPHYDMAQSFQRLYTGNPKESDIIMLQHESLESYYMNHEKMDYDEAHKKANIKFNYQEAIKNGED